MKNKKFLIIFILSLTIFSLGFSEVENQGIAPEDIITQEQLPGTKTSEEEQPPNVEVLAERINSSHPHKWENGVCQICFARCIHEWDGDMCKRCKMICEHKKHDPDTLICTTCHNHVWHRYKDGFCQGCDKPLIFYTKGLPKEYLQPAEHQGTIDHFCMDVTFEDGRVAKKYAKAYLPYGYDESRKYDLLILLPGAGDEEDCWIDQVWDYGNGPFIFRNIYDNMIEKGDCKPLIIVSVSATSGYYKDGFNQMPYIMRNSIVPFIVGRYSTYAESIKIDDIIKAREHLGLGGFSNGGLHTFMSGLRENYDLFANFMPLSGMTDGSGTAKIIRGYKNMPMKMLFIGGGLQEGSESRFKSTYLELVDGLDDTENGKNAYFISPDSGHDWIMCSMNIYNFLQVAFPD